MQIDEDTIEDVGERAKGLLRHYESQINRLYEQDGLVKIALPVELKFDKTVQGTKVKVKISFVTDKVEDESTGFVGQRQGDLFEKEKAKENVGAGGLKICPLRPDDLIYASFCNNSCPLRQQIILVDGMGMHDPEIIDEAPAQLAEPDMLQLRSCASWRDDDCKANIEKMLEPAAQGPSSLSTYRIMNLQTNEWWEGEAPSAADACQEAGWQFLNCMIKVRSKAGGGGWCKCREGEEKPVAAKVYPMKTKKYKVAGE